MMQCVGCAKIFRHVACIVWLRLSSFGLDFVTETSSFVNFVGFCGLLCCACQFCVPLLLEGCITNSNGSDPPRKHELIQTHSQTRTCGLKNHISTRLHVCIHLLFHFYIHAKMLTYTCTHAAGSGPVPVPNDTCVRSSCSNRVQQSPISRLGPH